MNSVTEPASTAAARGERYGFETVRTLPAALPELPRVAFMRPRFLRPDPALASLPFLFWLVDILRPRLAVQLGLGSGAGYFGLCQAVDRLGPTGLCLGLQAPRVGGVPADLAAHNAQTYQEFSTLTCEEARAAAERVPAEGVDLLIVDDAAGEVGEGLAEIWLPRLSDRAVIVLRGAAVPADMPGDGCPAIKLPDGEGLRAILYGPSRDERLERAAVLRPGTPGHAEAWQPFGRLGRALGIEAEAEAREAALMSARAALGAAEARAGRAEAEREEALAGWAERHARAAELEARLFDLRSHAQKAEDASTDAEAGRIAALEAEVAVLRASEATRFEELATLARMLEDRELLSAPAGHPDPAALEAQIAERADGAHRAEALAAAGRRIGPAHEGGRPSQRRAHRGSAGPGRRARSAAEGGHPTPRGAAGQHLLEADRPGARPRPGHGAQALIGRPRGGRGALRPGRGRAPA